MTRIREEEEGIENDVTARLTNLNLTPEVDRSRPCHGGDLCQFALKSVHSFSKYSVNNLVADERANDQTDGRRDRSRTLCLRSVKTGVGY